MLQIKLIKPLVNKELISKKSIQEAKKYYDDYINRGFSNHRVLSNYGILLKSLGKLQ